MADLSLDQDPDEDAPKSRGSEAVERRIEKIISELKESGAMDVMNEREFEAKKVSFTYLRLSRFPHRPAPVLFRPAPLARVPSLQPTLPWQEYRRTDVYIRALV